jgi:hypothetical protein
MIEESVSGLCKSRESSSDLIENSGTDFEFSYLIEKSGTDFEFLSDLVRLELLSTSVILVILKNKYFICNYKLLKNNIIYEIVVNEDHGRWQN